MIKNVKVYDKLVEHLYNTKSKSKLVLATLSLAVGLSLTGCGTDKYSELDINRINTATTTLDDREEYYQKHVEEVQNNMTDAEKEVYYINLDIERIGDDSYPNDDLIFIRNDNVIKASISNNRKQISLEPGIYEIRSHNVEENYGSLGEIEILKPGENVKLTVNYDTKTVSIDGESKSK